jgi:hypothetical protein
MVCPWNRFCQSHRNRAISNPASLDNAELAELFRWSEDDFSAAPKALRRAGYAGCATWPSVSAMLHRLSRYWKHLSALNIPPHWYANMSNGHWRNTASDLRMPH